MLRTRYYLWAVLAVLLPCLLGMTAMIAQNVSLNIWLQNILAIILFSLAAGFILRFKINWNYKLLLLLCDLLMILPFLQKGIDGVHRWISFGGFSVNISMILLPVVTVSIYHLIQKKQLMLSIISVALIALILSAQPDASQLTGFSMAMILCFINCKLLKSIKIIGSGILLLMTVWSWIHIDSLEPVSYTEGILVILSNISPFLYIVGLAALFLIPVPFIIFTTKYQKVLAICIALYYWGIILSALIGNFPVPMMGYGISPIIGYFIVMILLNNEADAE